jgi:tetratricopeptide (TPR) repeat protein
MNKLTTIITLFLIYNTASWGQANDIRSDKQQTIDSFKTRLQQNLPDTERVSTLNELAWQLNSINPDTAFALSMQALELAKQSDFPKGIGQAHLNLGGFNYLRGNYPKSIDHYTKAMQIWKKVFPPSGGHKGSSTLSNLGLVYKEQGDYPKALEYY